MRLSIETLPNDKIKVTVEREGKIPVNFLGDRTDFVLELIPEQGNEEDQSVMDLYERFRVKHPKSDGKPLNVKDK